MKRFLVVALLCSLILGACAGGPSPIPVAGISAWNGGPVVRTRYGAVQGLENRDGTWVWKAVPYARPPVGELRWKAPLEPEPWGGVRFRHTFACPAVQFDPITGVLFGKEDCLYLNIWRPRNTQTKLPVYVWIHGGANSVGSSTYLTDSLGYRLAASDNLVFVSINYRLGPFGWFTHPALREGLSAADDSGNFGTLDLIQALRWIRDNIAAFGGDPGTVLIAGESAGAMNVLSLLLAPAAAGLFHRAMIQSGVVSARNPREGEERAQKVILQLLKKEAKTRIPEQTEEELAGMPAAELRAFLRARPARAIMHCFTRSHSGMIDNPTIFADGSVLPASGFAALARGNYPSKVPIIIGSNREELSSFMIMAGSPPWNSELFRTVTRFGSERWKANSVDSVARRLSTHADQPLVYAYLFGWGSPDAVGWSPLPGTWGQRLGAFHGLEIPFFLGTDTIGGPLIGALLFTQASRPGREALSAIMRGYLSSFLRTGNPNPEAESQEDVRAVAALPHWAAWSNAPGGQKCILFDMRGNVPDVQMSEQEVTAVGIAWEMQFELSPELLSTTREILARPLTGPVIQPLYEEEEEG